MAHGLETRTARKTGQVDFTAAQVTHALSNTTVILATGGHNETVMAAPQWCFTAPMQQHLARCKEHAFQKKKKPQPILRNGFTFTFTHKFTLVCKGRPYNSIRNTVQLNVFPQALQIHDNITLRKSRKQFCRSASYTTIRGAEVKLHQFLT
jgi:hypothetical protein